MNGSVKKTNFSTDFTAKPKIAVSRQWNKNILIIESVSGTGRFFKDLLCRTENVVSFHPRSTGSGRPESRSSGQNENVNLHIDIVNSLEEAKAKMAKMKQEGQPYAMCIVDIVDGGHKFEVGYELQKQDPYMYFLFAFAWNESIHQRLHLFAQLDKYHRWDYVVTPITESEINQKVRNAITLWNLKKQREYQHLDVFEFQHRLLGAQKELLSSIGRGKKSANDDRREMIEIKDLLDKALEIMQVSIVGTQFKICFIRSESALLNINPYEMIICFLEIIGNSVKVSGAMGQIDISMEKRGSHFEISFHDYGPGISKKTLELIKNGFVSEAGDMEHFATGFHLCDEVARRHNGEIKIENHGVKGLQVTIKIPI